jgi:hypothetical protein
VLFGEYVLAGCPTVPGGELSLPLTPGQFFPDFITERQDGRMGFVEYKNLSGAAQGVGELWAAGPVEKIEMGLHWKPDSRLCRHEQRQGLSTLCGATGSGAIGYGKGPKTVRTHVLKLTITSCPRSDLRFQ